jgi:hypothetical protein
VVLCVLIERDVRERVLVAKDVAAAATVVAAVEVGKGACAGNGVARLGRGVGLRGQRGAERGGRPTFQWARVGMPVTWPKPATRSGREESKTAEESEAMVEASLVSVTKASAVSSDGLEGGRAERRAAGT